MSPNVPARARLRALSLFAALISVSGCATAFNHPGRLFLHGDISGTQFAIDGKPVTPTEEQYSASEVSRTSTTVTYMVTYLPAVTVDPAVPYHTLTVDNGKAGRRDLLLKRDLIDGYQLVVYGDMLFTFGIGTLIDIYGDQLWGMPRLEMADIMASPASAPAASRAAAVPAITTPPPVTTPPTIVPPK